MAVSHIKQAATMSRVEKQCTIITTICMYSSLYELMKIILVLVHVKQDKNFISDRAVLFICSVLQLQTFLTISIIGTIPIFWWQSLGESVLRLASFWLWTAIKVEIMANLLDIAHALVYIYIYTVG